MQAVLSMVAAGSGISLFPETVTQIISVGIVFKKLTGCRPVLEHSFVWLKNRTLPEMDAFLEMV